MSCTFTVKLPLARFPAVSCAEQLTVVIPRANVLPEAGKQTGETEPSTRSVADAAQVALAPLGPVASFVMFVGTVNAGGVVSCTVTSKRVLPALPATSRAEQVTCVVPSANVLPDKGEQVTLTLPSTASFAVGAVQDAVAPPGPVASSVMLLGVPLIDGGVVSRTVTVKLPVAWLVRASVDVQLTVAVPSANVLPDGGKQVTPVAPSTRSVAVAL